MTTMETKLRALLASPQTMKTVILALREWVPKTDAAGRKRAVLLAKTRTNQRRNASGVVMMELK